MSWKDRDGLNKRRMLEVVRANEGEEFIAYFPQVSNRHYQHNTLQVARTVPEPKENIR
jgi:hypothetical protein